MTQPSVFRYKHADLSAWTFDRYEFGYPMADYFWHKLPDNTFVASLYGHRIYEIHPDNSQYLIYNAKTHTPAFTRRYSNFVINSEFVTRTKEQADGQRAFEITVYQTRYDPSNRKLLRTHKTSAIGNRVFKLTEQNGMLTIVAELTKAREVRVRDDEKYKAFNKQLNQLRKVLIAQTRMGAYDDLVRLPKTVYDSNIPSLGALLKLALNLSKDAYASYREIENTRQQAVMRWMSGSPSELRLITLCSLFLHESGHHDARQNVALRIKSGLVAVQRTYLRTECVKIVDSNNSLSLNNESDDQDSELLEAAGL